MNFTFIEKQGWGGNHGKNAIESIVCSDLANSLKRLFSHESSSLLGLYCMSLKSTCPCTQLRLVSSAFHLMPWGNSNLPLDEVIWKGEKRYSHLLSRKNAFCRILAFFWRKFAPRYISWPSELRYSGFIFSDIEAAVSLWKSLWTFLKTRSMSRSFFLIWFNRCFMYTPTWVPVRRSLSSKAFMFGIVPYPRTKLGLLLIMYPEHVLEASSFFFTNSLGSSLHES